MHQFATPTTQLIFDPPAAGRWELETTHHGLRPLSPFVRHAYVGAFEEGTKELVERYGLPLEGVRAVLVHGCMYVRPQGLGEGSKAKPPPPKLIMKIVARLHPEMRRRTRTAARAWQTRRWRSEVDQWCDHDRHDVTATNLAFQSVDLATLDDEQLNEHIAAVLAHFRAQMRRNPATHGGDLMPTGDLLAHCEAWGISPAEAADLLRGSSPATLATARLLAPVAVPVRLSNHTPTSVDEVRQLSDETRAAVDLWSRLHAWRLVASDDIDRPTLAEMPGLALAALLDAAEHDPAEDAPLETDSPRQRVPAADRALFDTLVTEARYGMRQREDIRGVCWNWAGGM